MKNPKMDSWEESQVTCYRRNVDFCTSKNNLASTGMIIKMLIMTRSQWMDNSRPLTICVMTVTNCGVEAKFMIYQNNTEFQDTFQCIFGLAVNLALFHFNSIDTSNCSRHILNSSPVFSGLTWFKMILYCLKINLNKRCLL